MKDYKQALLKSLQEPATHAPAWSVQDMISRPLASVKPLTKASETSEGSPLPMPHGSTYDSLHNLTVDVMKRCAAAGLSLQTTLHIVSLVTSQFEEQAQ